MWIKASYTVESAVIVPIFSLIIVIIISFTCNIHDQIIRENIMAQVAIEDELNDMSSDKTNNLEKIAGEYLKERCLFSHNYVIKVENASIEKSEPEKTIRIMKALIEAID